MKVFISHKSHDSLKAKSISDRLRYTHGISTYLDVIDDQIGRSPSSLADYIRDQLEACTSILAVVSNATVNSWWVPWELGVATEKMMPQCTFTHGVTKLPEYLSKWPKISTETQLDGYVSSLRHFRSDRQNRLQEGYGSSFATKRALENYYSRMG